MDIAKKCYVGDCGYLGHWEQNGKKGDGAEKIRWLVLDVSDGKLFLLSDKALANLPFNKKSNGATWKDCSLRKWLNNDFYKGAFSSKEKAAIQTTKVYDNAAHSYAEFNTAKRFSGTTKDKVFLLSYLELCKYLDLSTAACEPTTVVSKSKNKIRVQKDGKHKYCYWWLRTSAYKNNAMFMTAEGFASAYEHHAQICVRPALWVDS